MANPNHQDRMDTLAGLAKLNEGDVQPFLDAETLYHIHKNQHPEDERVIGVAKEGDDWRLSLGDDLRKPFRG